LQDSIDETADCVALRSAQQWKGERGREGEDTDNIDNEASRISPLQLFLFVFQEQQLRLCGLPAKGARREEWRRRQSRGSTSFPKAKNALECPRRRLGKFDPRKVANNESPG